ncbi:hypothetical protein ACFL14_00845 [Patescibacteria group bacterium]
MTCRSCGKEAEQKDICIHCGNNPNIEPKRSGSKYTQCPHCKEKILQGAFICKHCKKDTVSKKKTGLFGINWSNHQKKGSGFGQGLNYGCGCGCAILILIILLFVFL